jgi:nicotinate-nucleotide adenylyltransferase
LAQEAFWQLGLDRVVLMPVGNAPHKEVAHDPGADERYLMCDLAAWGAEWLEASRLEIERAGPTYTVDTLRQLKSERPRDEIAWLLGGDQARNLPQWREPEQVLQLAALAVARRNGVADDDVRSSLAGLAGADRVRFFDMPPVAVSSSLVRERAAAGRPFRFLVPERVAQRIEELGLYREGSA